MKKKRTIEMYQNMVIWTVLVVVVFLCIFQIYKTPVRLECNEAQDTSSNDYFRSVDITTSGNQVVLNAYRQVRKIDSVGTGSMIPLINGDTELLVIGVNENEIDNGDIIVYTPPGEDYLVSHRVIELKKINGTVYYQTMGDANSARDNYLITFDNIKGKVVGIIY